MTTPTPDKPDTKPDTKPAAKPAKTVTLAPPVFVAEFRVGDTVITAEGTELSEAEAEKVLAAAALSGLALREIH